MPQPAGPTIIEGTVVGERPNSPRRRRVKPWQWSVVAVLGSALLCCVGVPAAWFGVPFIRGTIAAEAGSSTPTVALEEFVTTFDDSNRNGELLAARTIVSARVSAVLAERRTFLSAKADDERKHPEIVSGRLEVATPPDGMPAEYQTVHGDTAEVLRYYRVAWGLTQSQVGATSLNSAALPWLATVRHDWDGWRLVSVKMPPWCGSRFGTGDADGYAGCR